MKHTPTHDVSQLSEHKLDVDNIPTVMPKQEVQRVADVVSEFEEDFNIARDTIVDILTRSADVIEAMTAIAKESDSARAYEVLANMMKDLVKASESLVDIHDKKVNIVKNSGNDPDVQNNTQNNYYFSGSADDLHKALDAKRGKK